ADAGGELDMVAVAGGEVVAGLGDADDRLAGLELGAGEAVVQVALHIERGHARIMRVVEPFLRAEVAASAVAGGMPIGRLFCHWSLLQCTRTVVRFNVSACAMPSGASDVCRPAGGSFPHKCDTSHGYLVTLPFCSRRRRRKRPACCPS